MYTLRNLVRPLADPTVLDAALAQRIDPPAPFDATRWAQLRTFCPGAFGLEVATLEEIRELWSHLESVDVVRAEDETLAFVLYLWPSGAAALFAGDGVTEIGYACQHGFVLHAHDDELHLQLGLAFIDGKPALGIGETIDF